MSENEDYIFWYVNDFYVNDENMELAIELEELIEREVRSRGKNLDSFGGNYAWDCDIPENIYDEVEELFDHLDEAWGIDEEEEEEEEDEEE